MRLNRGPLIKLSVWCVGGIESEETKAGKGKGLKKREEEGGERWVNCNYKGNKGSAAFCLWLWRDMMWLLAEDQLMVRWSEIWTLMLTHLSLLRPLELPNTDMNKTELTNKQIKIIKAENHLAESGTKSAVVKVMLLFLIPSFVNMFYYISVWFFSSYIYF